MKINKLSHITCTICMLSLGIGGSLFAQFPGPPNLPNLPNLPILPDSGGGIPASGIPRGKNPAGVDTEIFASDKVAFGHHLADVLSKDFYPEDEAKLTLFRNRTHKNGSASYKFTQEIAGLPVIHGMIVLHTNDQGVIYYRRGPVLRGEHSAAANTLQMRYRLRPRR